MTKPLDSQAAEQASSTEPVKAGKDYWECCAADGVTAALDFVHASDSRDASHEWLHLDTLADEVRWLRKERDLFRTASEAAELRIVEMREKVTLMGAALKQQDEAARVLRTMTEAAASKLSAKLARVEALVQHGTVSWETVFDALQPRDEPQPEREPKLPYNGY